MIEGEILDNNIEKLKAQGYTEEQINVILGNTKINVSDNPMGENREDRGVNVSVDGHTKKTSNIMMGYNRDGVILTNGEYVPFEEVENALFTALSTHGNNVKVACVRTGKVISPLEMVDKISSTVKKASVIKLNGQSVNVKNQDTQTLAIKGKQKKDFINKGLMMLGNEGIKLPNGEYVQASEVQNAIKDYVILKGPEAKQNTVKKVVSRVKTEWKSWPVILASVMLIISMIGVSPSKNLVDQVVDVTSDLEFVIDSYDVENRYETAEEIAERALSKFKIGKSVEVQEGVTYHESSDYDLGGANKSGVFGKGLRDAGNYTVDLFSIISGNRIVKVSSIGGTNLNDVAIEAAQELGVPVESLTIRVHLGGPVSGWVDITDLMNSDDLVPQVVEQNTILDKKYTGVQENFEGSISFVTDHGEVQANVLDQNGNLLPSGSIVVASDGQEYKLASLNESSLENIAGINNTNSKQVTFGLQNLTTLEAFASAATFVLGELLTNKKEKEEKEVTEEEYQKMLDNAKKKYDSNSKFVRLVNKLHGRKPNWEKINFYMRKDNLGVDYISEMYEKDEGTPKL